jgi:hypothetical protein
VAKKPVKLVKLEPSEDEVHAKSRPRSYNVTRLNNKATPPLPAFNGTRAIQGTDDLINEIDRLNALIEVMDPQDEAEIQRRYLLLQHERV